MSEPLVCAIMLTRDRPAMARRAVECFRRQTYPESHRALFILDNGAKSTLGLPYGERLVTSMWVPDQAGKTIGFLRNGAIRSAIGWLNFDVIVTMDDDDWSHPNRIAEQVKLLEESGAEAVGYHEMIFWRTPQAEAWLWSHRPPYAAGTSLCYWRRTWERRPFPDEPKAPGSSGEDHLWQKGVALVSESSVKLDGPRMIAAIHPGNSSKSYDIETLVARGAKEWIRVPKWDQYCGEAMEL